LSARSSTDRRRCGPRRDRTAGMPRTSGFEGEAVVHFCADTATASGMPWASDSTYSLLPFVPRSTGFGPVSDPPFWRERRPRRRSPRSSPPRPGPRVRPAPPGAVAATGRPRSIGAALGQRVHHCREHGPLVTRSGPTTLRTSSERRQQRGGRLPEFIRNQTLR
jgi:hypothetical protein